MPMPAQPFGWFKKNVTKVSDVKGMKYRTVGLATNVLTAMGMVVRQLPGGEIQPAMKTGLIEAAEFNNPTSDSQFGMQDVSKHYHLGSFHQSQEMFEIPVNKKTYNINLQEGGCLRARLYYTILIMGESQEGGYINSIYKLI